MYIGGIKMKHYKEMILYIMIVVLTFLFVWIMLETIYQMIY